MSRLFSSIYGKIKSGVRLFGLSVPFLFACYPAFAAPPIPAAATGGGSDPGAFIEVPLPEPTPEVVPIPPVVQRPLGVEEGDRIFVKQFQLVGAVDRVENGVSIKEITDLLENQRLELQQLTDVEKDGFTGDERGELVAFFRDVVDSPDLDMKFDEYQALIDKMRLEKLNREQGLTIGQLQLIADGITSYYRKAGFVLAKAYVPAQEVEGGVISIEVVEGKLGQVLVEGNQRFSKEMLARTFEELIDAPVMGDTMETALSLLSDYPGVNVFGVLQPGTALGTTDLMLKVQGEKRYNIDLAYDNHGSRHTGERRMMVDFALNSPLLSADRLSGSLLRSHSEKNQVYGSLDYQIPLFSPTLALGGGYNRNDFNIGRELKDDKLAGISVDKYISLQKTYERSRLRNLRGKMDFTRRRAETLQKTGGKYDLIAKDDMAVLGLELSFDRVNVKDRSIDAGTIRFDHGFNGTFGAMNYEEAQGGSSNGVPSSRVVEDGDNVGSGFNKVTLGLARVKKLSNTQTLLLRFNAQISRDPLLSSEQFAIGGPDSVRAFPVSEYMVDKGLFASIDWTINAPGFADQPAYGERTWGEILKLSLFADYGSGWLNRPTDDDKEAHLDRMSVLGAGAGMELLLPGDITARMQYSRPLGPEQPQVDDDHVEQFWFDLKYSF
ncbi:MAG: ShlB/FhaC/HecB family hemolysin secretion/activation protein [Gammaproteobacteria bacterium]|nr:ShlB/FhaC/HecB family hemolysin secretion/activation protein [Gammaproteobacteria bacterium]